MNCRPEFRDQAEETQALGMLGKSRAMCVTRDGWLELYSVLGVGQDRTHSSELCLWGVCGFPACDTWVSY